MFFTNKYIAQFFSFSGPANAGDASTSSGSGPAAKRAKTLRPAAYTKYPDYSFLFQMTVSGNKPIKKIISGSEEDTFRVLFVDKKHTKAKVSTATWVIYLWLKICLHKSVSMSFTASSSFMERQMKANPM